MPPGTCLTHEELQRRRDTLCSRPQHRNCSCTAVHLQERHRHKAACFVLCNQASIGALPRLHPGLLVARAQAADLAGRLQAHAQVGSCEMQASCRNQLPCAGCPLAAEELTITSLANRCVSGPTWQLACDAGSKRMSQRSTSLHSVKHKTGNCCQAGERHQRRRRRGRRDPKGRRALAGPRHQPPDRHRRPGRRRLVR